MKEEYKLVYGRNLPFKPNVVDRITIDETQSRVNELMGVSDMDVVRHLSKRSPDKPAEGIDEYILQVAGMMGLSESDIERYGYRVPSSESEMDLVGEERQNIDDAIIRVAGAMNVDPKDIKKFGHIELYS